MVKYDSSHEIVVPDGCFKAFVALADDSESPQLRIETVSGFLFVPTRAGLKLVLLNVARENKYVLPGGCMDALYDQETGALIEKEEIFDAAKRELTREEVSSTSEPSISYLYTDFVPRDSRGLLKGENQFVDNLVKVVPDARNHRTLEFGVPDHFFAVIFRDSNLETRDPGEVKEIKLVTLAEASLMAIRGEIGRGHDAHVTTLVRMLSTGENCELPSLRQMA